MQLVAIMADSANNEVLEKAVMADFVKVAVARDRDEGHEVTKIWRFRKSCLTEYTLAEVEDDIVGYFPEISSKKLGISLKYRTEGNFGGGEIWRIKQNITVGEIKFGELLAKRTPY